MKNYIVQWGWFVSLLFIFARCSSSANKDIIVAPSELIYSVNQLTIEEGQKASSIAPLLKGTPPFTFSVSNNPATSQIVIDNQGIISVLENITAGTYAVSVTASNSTNRATFPSVFTVNVKKKILPPSALAYTPNQLTLDFGAVGNSTAPSIQGTAPFTFGMTANPQTDKISINNQGVIAVATGLETGTYKISVSAKNDAGNVSFNDTFSVVVKPSPPSNLTYSPNTVEINAGTAVTSSLPSIQGTLPITYTMTTSPVTDKISIGNNGTISVASTLTAGTYNVNVTAKNEASTITFNNVFSVTVKSTNTPASPPSSLSYSPKILTIEQGKAGSSAAPTISGTSPFTFAIGSNNTANGQISINATTGVVSAGANTPTGTYMLTITAGNSAGMATFMGALTVVVNAPVVAVSFAKDIQPFLQVCGGCHSYNQYAAAKANIDNMLNRVQRAQGSGGFMPQGGSPLSKTQIDLLKKWVDDGLKE